MGIVYQAHHETLDQSVAIKILRAADLEDREAAVRRFEREARIIAKLGSAHVVKVIDVDRTEDGVPYLVMERLAGRDLSAEVEARGEGRVPPREVVTWMAQVCAAMVVAHEAGVVHRDLKLSNVFLCEDGVVKVLDFGVAVLKHGDAERSITTSLAGTPRYMAPEQLLGESPNPASDVWAIGVMLYRLLGGRFPFDAPTMAAQMLAMMEGCPPLGTLAPELSAGLVAVVHKALGHGLDQRWRTARELADALAPFANPNSEAVRIEAVRVEEAEEPAPVTSPAPAARGGARWLVAAFVAIVAALGVRALVVRSAPPHAVVIAPAEAAAPTAVVVLEPVVAATASIKPAVAPPASSERRAPRPRPRPPAEKVAPPAPSASDDGFPAHL